MRRKLIALTAVLVFVVTMSLPAYSSMFYSLSHDDFNGYEIVNKSKMLISPFYDRDNSIQPGETRKFSNSNKQNLFRWSITSSKEAYLYDENYYIMLDKNNNKLTINSSNTFKNAFPWSIKKIKDNEDFVLNISANCGEEVYYSYSEYSYKIKKIPSKIVIPKDKIDYLVKVFIRYKTKVYCVDIFIPFKYKGGEYDLRFELWLNPKTTISMVNNDKKNLKLSGCECLQGLFNGCYQLNDYFDYAPGVMYYPSPYSGKHDFKNIVYNNKDKDNLTEAYSQNFSYDIHYYNQYYPQEHDGTFEVLRNEVESDKTEITVGDYFQNDTYIDIYDFSVRDFIQRKVKHYVCDKSKDITFFVNGDNGVNFYEDFWVEKSHSMIFNCGRVNDFSSKTIYTNKGLQFFEDEDYYLSGLTLKKSNPIRTIDGKMYINPKTFVSEIDGKVVKDDSKNLVISVKLSGSKNLSTISVDKANLNLTLDGKSKQLDGKITTVGNEIYVPLENFAKLLGCKTKFYTQEKSLCVTYDNM